MAAGPESFAHERFARRRGLGAHYGVARLEFQGNTRDAAGHPSHGGIQYQPPQSFAELFQTGYESFPPTHDFPGQRIWRFEQQRQCAEFQQSRRFQPRRRFRRWTLWWSPVILKFKIISSTI